MNQQAYDLEPSPGAFPDGPAARRATDPFERPGSSVASTGAAPSRPPRTRVPGVVTAAVAVLAVAVVGSATWVATRPEPAPVSAPNPVSLVRSDDSIAFTSAEGTGTLTVLAHRWVRDPGAVHHVQLAVRIQLTASDGLVRYDPSLLQVFDDTGALYDSEPLAAARPELGSGSLGPGESATGWVSFDVPRGDATLVLGTPRGESVTALKITG